MRTFLLFFFTAAMAAAQIVSVGVKGGVPATQAVSGYFPSPTNILDTGRWTIGPTIEFRLLLGFSVEVDALYRGYREQFSSFSNEVILSGPSTAGTTYPATFFASQSNNKVWDIPLLLKYRIGMRRLKPFVDAGYTFSRRTEDSDTIFACLSSASVCNASDFAFNTFESHYSFTENTGGPTAGVGVEYRYGRVKFAPEVRFTRLSQPTANILTVMVGVTF
jgi:hypothetical protein